MTPSSAAGGAKVGASPLSYLYHITSLEKRPRKSERSIVLPVA
jgi:hypothetical protein